MKLFRTKYQGRCFYVAADSFDEVDTLVKLESGKRGWPNQEDVENITTVSSTEHKKDMILIIKNADKKSKMRIPFNPLTINSSHPSILHD